ncbi:MAG: RNase A-like domain-containing protein [Xanthobacteraceae bacterium]
MPAGSSDGGQWTSGGGFGSNNDPDADTSLIPIAGNDPENRYSVDLEEEDRRGGHGHKDHVSKTDKYLLDVLDDDWIRRSTAQYEVTVFRPAEGSFESSLQANDLVNQTLRLHKDTVDLVASGQLEGATLNHRFGYQTGKEAFRPNGDAEPYIRPTYGVIVIIRHDPRWERGYRVHTAYPTNRTSK